MKQDRISIAKVESYFEKTSQKYQLAFGEADKNAKRRAQFISTKNENGSVTTRFCRHQEDNKGGYYEQLFVMKIQITQQSP